MPVISKTEQLKAAARFSFGCLSFWDLFNPRIKKKTAVIKRATYQCKVIIISADYASDGGSTDQNLRLALHSLTLVLLSCWQISVFCINLYIIHLQN